MLRNRMLGGASWLVLRDADRGAGPGVTDSDGAGGGAGGSGGDQGGDGGAGGGDQGGQDGAASGDNGGAAANGSPDGGGAGDQGGASGAAAAGGDGGGDWRDRELERRSRRVREEKAKAATLEEENRSLREILERMANGDGGDGGAGAGSTGGNGGANNGGGRTYTQQDVQREAERLAAERMRTAEAERTRAEFDRQCNQAVVTGRTEYGAQVFDASLAKLGQIGFYGDDGNNYENLNMALATDDPHGVMHELAQNPGEYFRIMDLPPLRRHGEFVKLALKATASREAKKGGGNGNGSGNGQRRPSGAPPPTDPIGGNGGEVDLRYSDSASAADWHAQEDKREKEYWSRKNAEFRG